MLDKVADASVIAAMAFGEPEAHEARSLLDGADLYEPALLSYELTSIARTKSRRYPDQTEQIVRFLNVALATRVNWVEVNHVEVLRIALETGLSTYDASYLYVARTHGIPLVTFDERLRQASQP
ncbi:MAG: type II toxin-antitoxin system VapC family toxin [Chloroflexi bacterium]|nr:type II toxin-antitoxin system VapC family toxin [Chloroflexota bacterium]